MIGIEVKVVLARTTRFKGAWDCDSNNNLKCFFV